MAARVVGLGARGRLEPMAIAAILARVARDSVGAGLEALAHKTWGVLKQPNHLSSILVGTGVILDTRAKVAIIEMMFDSSKTKCYL